MNTWPTLVVILLLAVVVFASLWNGVRMGRKRRRTHAPDDDQLGTIQAAMLGLLGLLLGFSFSGAMSRFNNRQDALWAEASAVKNAYERAELLPNGDQVRRSLREYAALRLELLTRHDRGPADDLTGRMLERFDAARVAAFEGVRQAPQYATVVVPGLQAVGDEFARRNAFERRHLPGEMVIVLIVSSCLAMGTIGYGVGLSERRTAGMSVCLAALVTATLFVTIDFDRPGRGFITLDPAALEDLVRDLNRPDAPARR